jgi:hypothetical protein
VFASHHPYVAGPTETDGTYVLDHVPPGTYDVVAWHGPMHVNQGEPGPRHLSGPYSVMKRVTVGPRTRPRLDFTLGPP